MTIHLIAAGKLENPDKWPELWHHCYNIWKSSPYEIKLWGDKDIDNLLKEDDEKFFSTLQTLPPIYKWDYVRYIILEKFGGAYFDMDVEIIDGSFLQKLHPHQMYFMEGTTGTYLENSIMITPSDLSKTEYWKRLKHYSKYNIKNTPIEHLTKMNVVWKVGAGTISKFFLDHLLNTEFQQWDVLGYHQFGSKTNSLSYTHHHQISNWN